jgi:Predicted integral membrane protein
MARAHDSGSRRLSKRSAVHSTMSAANVTLLREMPSTVLATPNVASRRARILHGAAAAAGVVVFMLALVVLRHAVGEYDYDDVRHALRAVPAGRLWMSLGFAALGYISLTGYDVLALRYVGRTIPYRQSAMASFVSYAIGNNAGFGNFASSSIRYRLYAGWGLGALDIAKLITFCTLTFWSGFLAVAGVALTFDPFPLPHRIQLPVPLRTIGVLLLVLLAAYARILLALARDGLISRSFFGAVHPRFRTPHKATIVTGVLVALAGAIFPLKLLADLVNIGTLMAFVIVCAAVIVMRRTNPQLYRPFRTPWMPFVPLAGIFVNLAMMFSLGWENWLRLAVWLLIGLVIYVFYGRRHSRLVTGV